MGLTFPYELANGNTADADEVMANFNEIKNNFDTDTVDDASANSTEMQETTDPYPGDSESLATELRGELKRLRYLIKQITGKSQWYIDPDTNLLLEFNKGADIASANPLVLGADGNYFDVTGTTNWASINTRRVGSIIKLHFDGILTITHDGDNIVLPGEANITTAAGDELEFYEYDTGKFRCTNYLPLAGSVDTTHDHTGGDGAALVSASYTAGSVDQDAIGASVVGTGELKTTTGEVNTTSSSFVNLTLPGGGNGFYPQVRKSAAGTDMSANIAFGFTSQSYTSIIALKQGGGATAYAKQRYIQASPPYKIGNKKWGHFLYLLVNAQGDVISSYEAEDPPYAYNGPPQHKKDSIERIQAVPHPFVDYWDKDPATDGLEIVLVDLRGHNTKKWKGDNIKKGKGVLEDLGHINKSGKIIMPQELGIQDIQGFTDKVKIRKHN